MSGKPTIVIGSAERTGKSSTAWVLTLLHEHFHQWQYSRPDYYAGVARLDLAHGDSTGQWMLDYAFPYDSAPVQQAVRRLATALGQALDAPPGARNGALKTVVSARDTLRGRLTAADYRYFEFQLWQEGVARFIEYAAARAAAASPGSPRRRFGGSPITSRTARPPPRRAEACDGSWSNWRWAGNGGSPSIHSAPPWRCSSRRLDPTGSRLRPATVRARRSAPRHPLVRHDRPSPVDGTYELFRHFYGLRRFNKGKDKPSAPSSACCTPCSR